MKAALKTRDTIISKVARRIRKKSKFGTATPATYEEAIILDRQNGNTLWQDAVKKEMKNVEIAFKFIDNGEPVPIGFKRITCHLIFDVKFDLTRKA